MPRPIHAGSGRWLASPRFPEEMVDNIGYALGVVQYGGHPPSAKPWKGLGAGIRTARTDVALVGKRLKDAIQDHEERYGKEKS